jgi:hypothetical protein
LQFDYLWSEKILNVVLLALFSISLFNIACGTQYKFYLYFWFYVSLFILFLHLLKWIFIKKQQKFIEHAHWQMVSKVWSSFFVFKKLMTLKMDARLIIWILRQYLTSESTQSNHFFRFFFWFLEEQPISWFVAIKLNIYFFISCYF